VVSARTPDYTAEDEGYGVFPHLEWITVTPERVVISASDTGEVLITVAMPEDADYSGKKSEVWISFKEEGAPGMVQIELASRIFISTRVEEPTEPAPEPEAPETTGEGGVGITAEAVEPETASPEPESRSTWAILGPVLGAATGIFFLVRRKKRA